MALEAYDRMIGLALGELSVDGCITKAPSGGGKAGRSPVDRSKQGLKRSVASERLAPARPGPGRGPKAARRDARERQRRPDRGYASTKSYALIAELGFTVEISRKGIPAPIQVSKRWVIERTRSWTNGYGKPRRCTEKNGKAVDFYLCLAAALVTLRMLLRRSTSRYRWDGRPTTRRLK